MGGGLRSKGNPGNPELGGGEKGARAELIGKVKKRNHNKGRGRLFDDPKRKGCGVVKVNETTKSV